MHHTDYSNNLRKAQHKSIKNSSPIRESRDYIDDKSKDLMRAAAAAVLVLVALLQMDPANAQDTLDMPGYGSLQLSGAKAQNLSSQLKMVIHDEQVSLIVKQTFNNPSDTTRTGEYVFALPENALILNWEISRMASSCDKTKPSECHLQTITHVNPSSDHVDSASNILTIPLGELRPDQQLSIKLNITLPTEANDTLLAATLPPGDLQNQAEHSQLRIAAELIGSVASSQPLGVMQPL